MTGIFSRLVGASRQYATFAQVAKTLEKHGFEAVRQNGSHVQFNKSGKHLVTVPDHGKKDIATGTLSSIIRQAEGAGIERAEFKKNIGFGKGR